MRLVSRSTRRALLLVAAAIFLYGLLEIFLQAPAGAARQSAAVLVLLTGLALGLVSWWAGRHLKP